MKRIAIILVILALGFVIFAATDATTDLNIATSVADKFGLVIHTGVDPESLSDFNGLAAAGTENDPISFDDSDIYGESERVLTVSAITNKTSGYKVAVIANPLSAQNSSTNIGYTVRIVGDPDTTLNVLKGDSNKEFNLMTFNASGGLYIISQDFGITIDATDYEGATAGDYTAEWTVSLTTT